MRRDIHLQFLHLAMKEEWREAQGILGVKIEPCNILPMTSKEKVVGKRQGDVLTGIYQTSRA